MSYTLRLSNGKILLTLADQQLDNVSTSITLIGKNVNAYGDDINTNFIHLMENFSNETPPTSPLVGQLWFDRFSQRINVYTDSLQFKPVGGPILSSTQPEGLVAGDLWIDTLKNQMSFYDGESLTLIGPGYDASKGKSGILAETIMDTANSEQMVSTVYSNGTVIGVMSSSSFIPRVDYQLTLNGITEINPGVTIPPNYKFYGTALNSERLGDVEIEDIVTTNTTDPQNFSGAINIYNDDGLSVGQFEDLALSVNTANNRIASLSVGNVQDFGIIVKTQTQSNIPSFYFSTSTGRLGIFTNQPSEKVDINANVRIAGNLIVNGTATYVTVEDLLVTDRFISLSNGATDDSFSIGGGIYLEGTTQKRFTWQASSQAWSSTENMDLVSGKVYKINNQTVLTGNSLGLAVTSAPGLTRLGALSSLTVGQVYVTTASIGMLSVSPLILGSGVTTKIDFNGKQLTNAYTVVPGDGTTDDTVATVGYVKFLLASNIASQFALQIDVTGYAASSADVTMDAHIIDMLNNYLLPPTDPDYGLRPGSRARVLATRLSTTATTVVSDAIGFASVSVYEAGTTNPVDVVVNDRPYVASSTVPSSQIKVDKVVKQYRINNSFQWEAYPAGAGNNIIHVYGSW